MGKHSVALSVEPASRRMIRIAETAVLTWNIGNVTTAEILIWELISSVAIVVQNATSRDIKLPGQRRNEVRTDREMRRYGDLSEKGR